MSSEMKTVAVVGLLSLVILVGGVLGLSKLGDKSSGGGSSSNVEVAVDESDHSIGDGEKVVVEFADFQCPACAAAHPINKRVIEKYKGKIKWVFKHFPLSSHKNSVMASMVAEAAGAQGKFWEMHDKLFETQSEWESLSNPSDTFVAFAEDLGLDVSKFKEDMKNSDLRMKIENDRKQGLSLGVNATPSFVVGGVLFAGGRSESDWDKLILN